MTATEPKQQRTVLLPIAALLLGGLAPLGGRGCTARPGACPAGHPTAAHRRAPRLHAGRRWDAPAASRSSTGDERIAARFFDGSDEDAFVYAVRVNILHGLPLTQAERAAAAERIIRTHPQWSDRLIASAAGLAASTVASLRKKVSDRAAQLNARTGRDGRVRPLNAAEGRRRACALIAAKPQASLREIADAAGIALGTARDVRLRIRQGQDPVPKKLRDAENRDVNRPVGRTTTTPAAAPPVAPPPPVTDAGPALPRLRKDPSLRLTEGGRALLHLLSSHPGGERTRRLLESVPAHRRTAVAQAARACAESLAALRQ
ncbi:hypothetical protein GCM10020000_11650 [Streptomyces olivoverticillatus]